MIVDNKKYENFPALARVEYYYTWSPLGILVDIVEGCTKVELMILRTEIEGQDPKTKLTLFLEQVLLVYQLKQQYRNLHSLMAVEGDLFAAAYSGPLGVL